VDTDDLAAAVLVVQGVPQADQEDGVAADRVHVDGAVEGTDSRGWRLKPSSVLRTCMSAWSEGCVVGSGNGRLIRPPVSWLGSATVKWLLGDGPRRRLVRSKRAW